MMCWSILNMTSSEVISNVVSTNQSIDLWDPQTWRTVFMMIMYDRTDNTMGSARKRATHRRPRHDNGSIIENQNHESWTSHKNVDSGPTHASPNKPAKSGAVSAISSRNSVGKATSELANARLHDMEIMRVLLRRHAGNGERRSADGALRARADANGSITGQRLTHSSDCQSRYQRRPAVTDFPRKIS